jgi:hypothetical protein
MAALYKAQACNRGPSPDRSNQSSSLQPSLLYSKPILVPIEPGGAALAGRKRGTRARRPAVTTFVLFYEEPAPCFMGAAARHSKYAGWRRGTDRFWLGHHGP